MAKYGVYHGYDVDGGFGDAIGKDSLVVMFLTKELAEAYCEKWNNGHVYEVPYAPLECGYLFVMEMPDALMGDESTLSIPPHQLDKYLAWAFDKESSNYREIDYVEEDN